MNSSGPERFVTCRRDDELATITLARGPVNALTLEVIDQLGREARSAIQSGARGVVLTGSGAFFSFGFDVPHVRTLSRSEYRRFLVAFCGLYRELFLLPVPLVAALNGHAAAGGCMLALAADRVILAAGRSKIGLNEIDFGSAVFAGSVEMLRRRVGDGRAAQVLLSGELFSARRALGLGLVDEVQSPERVLPRALECVREFAQNLEAFRSMKSMLRSDIGALMAEREEESIEAFLDLWYSEATQRQVAEITIRGR